jgi:hypothetical protein
MISISLWLTKKCRNFESFAKKNANEPNNTIKTDDFPMRSWYNLCKVQTANYTLPINPHRMQATNNKFPTTHCQLTTANYPLPTYSDNQ